ncbi:transketolase family protein [Irregularibacter muris]|uniref:Transketolase family protein n=2 Tax=Irregularibacter muris TaxID=1796619 RepID=A0AAE3HFV6_9FIRM|nr:transketolase family protein [Irregularibacter muris]
MSLSTREAYGIAIESLGDKYDFWVMDADLSKATMTHLFGEKFPDRFVNMGISESDLMTTAAGIASCGQMVFASTFAIFAAGRAFEQIRNSIAYTGLNVKIAATHGGVLIGEDGGSHQCIEDISLMRTLPNMTVIAPCDEASTFSAVEAAVKVSGPVYLRFGRFPAENVYTEGHVPFVVGKGNVIEDGDDVVIFAIGDMVSNAIKAAGMLAADGLSAAVIDMHTIKPIDKELILEYAFKTGAVVTAEDHNIIGGLGSAVAEVLAENPHAVLRRLGVKDTFGRSGKRKDLEEYFGLTSKDIYEKCRDAIASKNPNK